MLLSFAAAGFTVAAGTLHLTMAPQSFSHDIGQGLLFLIGGVLQIFWAVPVIKRWGRIWQIIGIVGTAVFVILFYLSRFHLIQDDNILGGGSHENTQQEFPRNMTGGEFPRGPPPGGMNFRFERMVPTIEICQIAFIGLYVVLSKMYSKKQKVNDDKQ